MSGRFRYSSWDGTQELFDLDSLSLLDQMSEDLTYNGDVQAALRRLMQNGMRDRDGNRLEGIRSMLERLRERRDQMVANNELGSVMSDLSDRLDEIIESERSYMDRQEQAAVESGDDEWLKSAVDAFTPKRLSLDLLPPDLSGQIRDLNGYSFANPDAAQRFAELVDELREQVMGSTFNQIAGAMKNASAEEMARVKDMLGELNAMLDARLEGREPDFDGFMERFGDMFPENPSNLDELLEAMARRMAAMQALMNSMTPQQRAELAALSETLMSDMDLRWQMDQLSSNLQQLFPEMGWAQSYEMGGQGVDPLDLASATDLMAQLGDIDRLEQLLRSASAPGALGEIDLEQVRELLGDEAANSLSELAQLQRQLEADGLVHNNDGRFELSPQGLRRLGQNALAHVFRRLDASQIGRHERPAEGIGHERSFQTKAFEYGDPFNLHIERTLRNAIVRTGIGDSSTAQRHGDSGIANDSGREPSTAGIRRLQLHPDDFEIDTTEQTVRCATVLMVDLSLSMHLRSYFGPAKQTALALQSLITSQFPRDYLGIVTFAESAAILAAKDLPSVSWDYAYGTNMHYGLRLARQLLSKQRGTKQILMITDGEPTAHNDPLTDQPIFSYPPSRETVQLTLREVLRCTKAGIRINTFMLEPDEALRRFVDHMTDMNRGRAFYATPGNLGDYVLVDFLENRKQMVRGRRAS